MLSQKALLLKPSPTLALANKARELAAQGQDVVALTVGEPDWPTFEVANQAGIEAIQKGFTKYTAASGMMELRAEVAKQTSTEIGVQYSPQQVVIGTGAKYVLYSLLQMLINPGDEVVIPAPYWVSYPMMAQLAGARVSTVDCSEKMNFKLTPEALAKVLTLDSKVLILCSPSNPTGLMYSKDELAQLAEVIKKFPKLVVISDDIYNKLVFSHSQDSANKPLAPHLLTVAPELKDRVVVVNGASKSFSMTGWRVGWALGPVALMAAMADFLSQTTSNLNSISQKAALAALQKGDAELKSAQIELQEKRNRFFKELSTLKKIRTFQPDGAFYFWMDVSGLFGQQIEVHGQTRQLLTSKDVAEVLLDKYYVAIVPGEEFGSPGFIRMSFAASDAELAKAVKRLIGLESDLR